jgi:hypothetical protein
VLLSLSSLDVPKSEIFTVSLWVTRTLENKIHDRDLHRNLLEISYFTETGPFYIVTLLLLILSCIINKKKDRRIVTYLIYQKNTRRL